MAMNERFFVAVRASLFGGALSQAQVDGINAIDRMWTIYGDGNRRHFAYILATAKHETANTMQPVRETLAKTDAKAKELLSKAWAAGKMPQVKTDYWSSGYFGRGFVQLTHKANYQKVQDETGHQLVQSPSLALDIEIAALILVKGMMKGWFTGKKLSDYSDFSDMRRVVNGTDRAALIAGYAEKFLTALPLAPAKPAPSTAPPPNPKPQNLWTTFMAAIAAFFMPKRKD